jgi:cyanate permease
MGRLARYHIVNSTVSVLLGFKGLNIYGSDLNEFRACSGFRSQMFVGYCIMYVFHSSLQSLEQIVFNQQAAVCKCKEHVAFTISLTKFTSRKYSKKSRSHIAAVKQGVMGYFISGSALWVATGFVPDAVECLTFLLHILEVPVSNLFPEICYHD